MGKKDLDKKKETLVNTGVSLFYILYIIIYNSKII